MKETIANFRVAWMIALLEPIKDHNWFILLLEAESPSGADNQCEWRNPEGQAIHRIRVAASCLPKMNFKYGRKTNGNINMEK